MKIINPTPLIDDYPFPEIVNRKKEQEILNKRFIKPLLNGKQPPGFHYITGGTGSGKTFVTVRLINDNCREIKKKLPRFEFIYLNVSQEGIPSYIEFYNHVNANLSSYLPVTLPSGLEVDIMKSWKSRTILTNLFTSIIEQKELNVLLVIDEVEKLLEIPNGDVLFYSLADMHNRFTGKSYGVFVIFITNDKTLVNKIVDKVDSRMPLHENFSNYTISDLFEILQVAAKYSCDNIDPKLLQAVAQEVADTSCSARDAKRLLHARLERGNMDEAIIELDKDSLKDDLKNLNPQQRVALQAVLSATEEFNRMQKKNIPRKYKDKFVTTQRTYPYYQKFANSSFLKTRSYRTFIRILDGLSHLGLISYERVSQGRAQGWAGKIEIISGIDFVKDTLHELIEKEKQEEEMPTLTIMSGTSGPEIKVYGKIPPHPVIVNPKSGKVAKKEKQEEEISIKTSGPEPEIISGKASSSQEEEIPKVIIDPKKAEKEK